MDDLNEKDWVRILQRALLKLVREVEAQAGNEEYGGVLPSVAQAAKDGRITLKALDRATLERGP